jgi:hypothetical protein
MFFYPFLPLLNRDHNSDSMVYINCASIARIKAENNSLNTRFSRRYIFLIANIILSSTDWIVATGVGLLGPGKQDFEGERVERNAGWRREPFV